SSRRRHTRFKCDWSSDVCSSDLEGCPHLRPAALKMKGFSDEVLDRIESQLASAFDLGFVFNRWTVGDDFCRQQLGFTTEQLQAQIGRASCRERGESAERAVRVVR